MQKLLPIKSLFPVIPNVNLSSIAKITWTNVHQVLKHSLATLKSFRGRHFQWRKYVALGQDGFVNWVLKLTLLFGNICAVIIYVLAVIMDNTNNLSSHKKYTPMQKWKWYIKSPQNQLPCFLSLAGVVTYTHWSLGDLNFLFHSGFLYCLFSI